MSGPARRIHVLDPEEVGTLVEWAADEGWNPGLGDAAAFRAADPEGFLGAFVEGELVAGIAAVAHGPAHGFIGLYITRPDMRGRGHGRAIWDAGMARLGARSIGLDGVPAQQANYRAMGFAPAYRTIRYSGRPAATGAPAASVEARLPAIRALDRRGFPAPRDAFLRRWLAAPRVARAVLSDGTVVGYGAVRRCGDGAKIGPLFAERPEVARALLADLAAACPGEIHIDVPETQAGFRDLLAGEGMVPGFETARMYRGPAWEIDAAVVYGVTTLELG